MRYSVVYTGKMGEYEFFDVVEVQLNAKESFEDIRRILATIEFNNSDLFNEITIEELSLCND